MRHTGPIPQPAASKSVRLCARLRLRHAARETLS